MRELSNSLARDPISIERNVVSFFSHRVPTTRTVPRFTGRRERAQIFTLVMGSAETSESRAGSGNPISN